jgi:hypothetical protein
MAMIYAQHFSAEEFREWSDDISPRLVTMLDVLRFRLGRPIAISASEYALGRELGVGKMSEHNIDEWGEVLAVDCFIIGVYNRAQAEAVVYEAEGIGFTGIGVYSDTHNNQGDDQVMFHLGVRPNEDMGAPATWGRISGKYTSLIAAIQSLKAG